MIGCLMRSQPFALTTHAALNYYNPVNVSITNKQMLAKQTK